MHNMNLTLIFNSNSVKLTPIISELFELRIYLYSFLEFTTEIVFQFHIRLLRYMKLQLLNAPESISLVIEQRPNIISIFYLMTKSTVKWFILNRLQFVF